MKANSLLVICLILAITFPNIQCDSSDSDSGSGSGSDSGSGGDSDSSGGTKYQPPVVQPPVVQPPVVQPPVVQPPVVQPPVQPPVVQPPITSPPYVIQPPTTYPPIVVQPPITYPTIVQPPVYYPTPIVYPPFPYVQPSVSPILPTLPSAWTPIVNFRNDVQVVLAINYLTTTFTTFRTVTIIQVSRQISNGYNYKFLVQFPYTSSFNTRSEIILHQSLTGAYSLAGNSYVNLPSFNSPQFVSQPYQNVPYFSDVNRLLQQNLGSRLGTNPSILDVRTNYPLYQVSYLTNQRNNVIADFSYDPLFGRLNLFGVNQTPYKK